MLEKELLLDEEAPPISSPLLEQQEISEIVPKWKKQELQLPQQRRLSAKDRFINLQCTFLNTFSTVTIVFMNKVIVSDPQLRKCQISIAAWHFLATAIVLFLATRRPFNAFPAVRVPVTQMLSISAFFAGFLLLGNLSLTYNSVGFYQLAKIMTTPTVVLLNFVVFGIRVSTATLLSVLASCAGVGLVTTTVLFSNPLGTIIATAAFTVTALYQIWIGKKIADLELSAPQLLLNQAPVSVGLLLCIMPFVDTLPDFSLIPPRTLYVVFASGVLASLLNLSQFLIIGRTSALTFNIISQVKTIVIVSLSWYNEGKMLTLLDICGVVLALGGAYSYSQFSSQKK